MEDKNHNATEENIRMHYGKIIKWLIIGWVVSVVALSSIFMS